MILLRRLHLPFLLLPLAACSGGGSAPPAGTTGSGAVYVVVDTASGSPTMVQFVVAGAALERADGSLTNNLLAAAKVVTFADPGAQADGLALQGVPAGQYARLHLMVLPGSGTALADGAVVPVRGAAELAVPLTDPLLHSGRQDSWLVVGNGDAPPAPVAGAIDWTPQLSGRTGGSSQELDGLGVAGVMAPGVLATVPVAGDGTLMLQFANDCTFAGDDGGTFSGRDDFLRTLGGDDDLTVRGRLERDGTCTVAHARRGRGGDLPRLLGSITELRPDTTSFVFAVTAEERRGERRFLPAPIDVLVRADQARIHADDDPAALPFSALLVGDPAKVKVASRTPVAGGLDLVVAREVEIRRNPAALQPEWQGAVQAVDAVAGTVTVVPRGDDPIVVQGVAVPQVTVTVAAGTPIVRRADGGGGDTTIGLADVVPGRDRIWWRGTVSGPTTIAATWVRVRAD